MKTVLAIIGGVTLFWIIGVVVAMIIDAWLEPDDV